MPAEPLHKRVDAVLRNPDYAPEDVVSMLSGIGPDAMTGIVRNSFEIHKCYQLDFFYRCGKPELKWLMSSLADSGNGIFQNYFMWQVLAENSSKAAFLKYDYRSFFRKWKATNYVIHPYVGGGGVFADGFDAACRKICRSCRPFAPGLFSVEPRPFGTTDMGYSLFQGRVLSTDVFKSLPVDDQWICLSGLGRCSAATAFKSRFVFSAIEDPGIAPEMKAVAVRSMAAGVDQKTCGQIKAMPENVRTALDDCLSFGEFNIRRSVICDDPGAVNRLLVPFLLYFRPEWLLEWYDVDGEEIDRVLRCRSTAEALIGDRR